MAKKKLTPKQSLFVKEYLKDLNATQAYMRAYKVKKTTAETNGVRMLGNAAIENRIQLAMDKRAAKVEISAQDVLESIIHIRELALTDAPLKDLKSALKANELLGRHLKLYTDKVEVSGGLDLALALKKARERIGDE